MSICPKTAKWSKACLAGSVGPKLEQGPPHQRKHWHELPGSIDFIPRQGLKSRELTETGAYTRRSRSLGDVSRYRFLTCLAHFLKGLGSLTLWPQQIPARRPFTTLKQTYISLTCMKETAIFCRVKTDNLVFSLSTLCLLFCLTRISSRHPLKTIDHLTHYRLTCHDIDWM